MSFRFFRSFSVFTLIAGVILFFSAPLSASVFDDAQIPMTSVVFADIDGIIGVPLEEYVDSVFDGISDKKTVLVFKLNTPGGLFPPCRA